MEKSNGNSITGIFIQETGGRFTAFFAEIPEATAQGDSMEEAEQNLFKILPMILEFKKEVYQQDMLMEDTPSVQSSTFTKSYDFKFQLA